MEKENTDLKAVPASWIDEEDHILLDLCVSIYSIPIPEKEGFVLQPHTEPSVRVWIRDQEVVVGIKGTDAQTGFSDLLDDAALAGLTSGACDLSVVHQAQNVIKELLNNYTDIKVCGHSLGGAAAFCIAHQFDLTRVVAFNGGAPPTGGGLRGTEKCFFYHIVGDIISTHVDDQSCNVKRIHFNGETNWKDVKYYHSTSRFYDHGGFEYWSAQQEQNDLADFVYSPNPGTSILYYLTGLVSKEFNKDRLREIVCKNAIPGTNPGSSCSKDHSLPFQGAIGAVLGGIVGGLTVGPSGIVSGSVIGKRIAEGEGIVDILTPNFFPTAKRLGRTLLSVGKRVRR